MCFEAKWTNDTKAHGTRARAMWHKTSEHLAHGNPSVIMHEMSEGNKWHVKHIAW